MDGLPHGTGWMSTMEVEKAVQRYVPSSVLCTSFTELMQAKEAKKMFCILFMRKHFIAVIECADGTYYFDSLGKFHLQTLITFSPPLSNIVAYQSQQSASCGVFVTLVASIYASLSTRNRPSSTSLQYTIDHLLTVDPVVNEFNVNLFAMAQHVGEEFENKKYIFTKRMVDFLAKMDINGHCL